MNQNVANWLIVGSALTILGGAALSLIVVGVCMVVAR
jgi:hypothetical protein